MPRKRRLWKTYHVPNRQEYRRLRAAWKRFTERKPHHVMRFDWSIIETNLPYKAVEKLFRLASVTSVKPSDCLTEAIPSWEGENRQ